MALSHVRSGYKQITFGTTVGFSTSYTLSRNQIVNGTNYEGDDDTEADSTGRNMSASSFLNGTIRTTLLTGTVITQAQSWHNNATEIYAKFYNVSGKIARVGPCLVRMQPQGPGGGQFEARVINLEARGQDDSDYIVYS